MPLAYIHPVGANGLCHISIVQATDPGFGHPGGAVDPGYGQGAWLRPDQGLPGGGYPSHGLPGSPGHPDNRPPSGGNLPQLGAGEVLVLVRDQAGVWHYAAIAPGSPPPRPVPVPPPNVIGGGPAQPPMFPSTGPINPPVVGGGPAPQPPPHVGGGPMPPQPTPTR